MSLMFLFDIISELLTSRRKVHKSLHNLRFAWFQKFKSDTIIIISHEVGKFFAKCLSAFQIIEKTEELKIGKPKEQGRSG